VTVSGQSSAEFESQPAGRAADGSRPRPLVGWLSDSRRVAAVLSILLLAFGFSVLVGRALGLPLLASWLPGRVETKVNDALCLTGLGLAMGLRLAPWSHRGPWLSWVFASVVALIAGATLYEHLSGSGLGIDEFLLRGVAGADSPHPGRFAIQTSLAFLSASIGVLTMGRRVRGVYPTEMLALVCGALGATALLGYMYGVPGLLSPGSSTQMSLPGASALIVTCAAMVASNPDHFLVRLMSDLGIAGQVMRRFIPAALIVIPAGALLRLVGQRVGLYDETVGLAVADAIEALALVAVGAWTTARVRRLEVERHEVLTDLIRLGSAASTPLIETAPVGLAVLDRDLRYLYVNPALAAISGLSAVASLGQRIDHLMPAFANEGQASLVQVVADGVPIREVEISGQTRPDGPSGTWLLSAEAIRESDGETIGLTISVVDITERKHREEALAAVAEMQRQAQAIGESIPFGIWLAERDGRMRYLSESFLQMIGQTMEQCLDSGWTTKLAPEFADQAKKDWAETVAARVPWNRELVFQDTNDSRRTILSRGFPIYGEAGEVTSWAGINLDMTDRKEAEEFREDFLGILSHELGTPTTSIFAASTLLQRPGLDQAGRNELLGDIGHEAEGLKRLVEDLVVLAHAERGTIQIHTEPIPLQHVLRKVCEQEKRRWPDCKFKLSIATPLPVARAEEASVEQIMRNLLDNAAKYGPSDGEVEVQVDTQDGWPRIRVLDRGPGIDPQEAERLFEVFYRSERTSRVAGSGIGLFVAHRLVESIGGTMWAKPREDGPGAEFGFRLQPFTEDAV
jgi:PAS domain S-box-containing protein